MCGHAGAVHFVRWTIEEGKVGLVYFPTNGMLADAVTKSLFEGRKLLPSAILQAIHYSHLHYTDTIGRLSVRDKQTTDPRGDRQ